MRVGWRRVSPFLPLHRRMFRPLLFALAALMVWVAWHAGAAEPVTDDYLLAKWDQDDGLPDNSVTALQQDAQGFLWIGTYNGLARFDGLNFVTFSAGKTAGLPRGKIRALLEDGHGALWIGLDGPAVAHAAGGQFATVWQEAGDPDDLITSLTGDAGGRIWGGLARGRTWRWESGKTAVLPRDPVLPPDDDVTYVADARGKVWYSAGDSYGYVDGDVWTNLADDASFPQLLPRAAGGFWLMRGNVLLIRTEKQELLYGVEAPWRGGSPEVQALLEDRNGALWIGTKGQGLFRFDGEFVRVPAGHDFILSLAQDRDGNIWAGGLGGGLMRLHPRQIRLHNEVNGFPADVVDAVCADGAGGLWITARNAGVIRMLGGKAELFSTGGGWPGGFVTTLCPDGQGGVWFGTLADGLVHWQEGASNVFEFKGEAVEALCAGSGGTLWIGTNHGLSRLENGMITSVAGAPEFGRVTALAQGKDGKLWVGTEAGALQSFDGAQWQTCPLPPDAGAVYTIVEEENGRLWLGLASGLASVEAGRCRVAGEVQGLPSPDIRQIVVGDGGALSIGTARGLFTVAAESLEAWRTGRRSSLECTGYTRGDGLGSIEFAEGGGHGACRTSDGRLWFATRRGLVEAPSAEETSPPAPPTALIEEVSLDGKVRAAPFGELLSAPPATREIVVRYTAASLGGAEGLHFRYRLSPNGAGWTEAGASRQAVFLNLPPGNYRVEIAAANRGAAYAPAKTATLEFEVQAAFWQKTWFRALAAAALAVAAGAVIRQWSLRKLRRQLRFLERQQDLDAERSRIARDMHDELGASLTSISLLSEQIRTDATVMPSAAVERVEKIARAARSVTQTLDEIVWTVNPRNDTLEGLIGYVGEYAAEYLAAAGVQLKLDLPEEAPALPLSSETRHQILLVMKEALNNSVKYSGAAEVSVEVTLLDDEMRLVIGDRGRGFSPVTVNGSANGLANMRHRATAAGGRCEIKSAPGDGVRVEAIFPLPRSPA